MCSSTNLRVRCPTTHLTETLSESESNHQCQTINKQNKQPCKASGILTKKGTIRCRIHGGWSTGAKTLDGLGMLVYQGALALTMWTGKEAPIKEMKEALSGFFARNG